MVWRRFVPRPSPSMCSPELWGALFYLQVTNIIVEFSLGQLIFTLRYDLSGLDPYIYIYTCVCVEYPRPIVLP